MPATLIGTLLIMAVCCAVMTLAVLFSGKPLPGGCGKKAPGMPHCEGCSDRDRHTGRCDTSGGGTT